MFDDHRVDRQRTVEFIRANGSLLRTVSSNEAEELTESMMVLLPNKVYGFILRSRRWHFLNIDNIRPLERHNDGFENLILPPGVARLVESLVKTHDPANMPSFAGSECDQEHHVDLVRGKGKGLIILLHGAPGVGKTSTAECVADYTHRPLFPITCGDIGETSKEVEQNLEQNFSLAHRWGCVLLVSHDFFMLRSASLQSYQDLFLALARIGALYLGKTLRVTETFVIILCPQFPHDYVDVVNSFAVQ
jgi:hypothetical protein